MVEFHILNFLFFLKREIIPTRTFLRGYFNNVILKFSFTFEGVGRGHAKDFTVLPNQLSKMLKCSENDKVF